MFMSVVSPVLFAGFRHQHMVSLARKYDKENVTQNLLVLDVKIGYAWNTDIYVRYLPYGSIRIKGASDKMSWWPIGELKAVAGKYTFSGLSNVEKETVGLVLKTD